MSDKQLPAWAEKTGENEITVDPAKFYPAILEELGVDEPDQYWLEVAYQCMKMDLQLALRKFGFMIKVINRPHWRIADHPEGRGVEAATKGGGARAEFKRIRGFLPA